MVDKTRRPGRRRGPRGCASQLAAPLGALDALAAHQSLHAFTADLFAGPEQRLPCVATAKSRVVLVTLKFRFALAAHAILTLAPEDPGVEGRFSEIDPSSGCRCRPDRRAFETLGQPGVAARAARAFWS